MRMYDLIEKKKRGGSLSAEEIAYMVREFVAGDIPDYQMSAMLMAVYFKGMDDREITDLTLEMAHSGDMVDLSPIEGIKADKHSTGGVGDKTTLVTGPIAGLTTLPRDLLIFSPFSPRIMPWLVRFAYGSAAVSYTHLRRASFRSKPLLLHAVQTG